MTLFEANGMPNSDIADCIISISCWQSEAYDSHKKQIVEYIAFGSYNKHVKSLCCCWKVLSSSVTPGYVIVSLKIT